MQDLTRQMGATPGPKGVVKQHKIMASGYELPSTERRVDTFQDHGETGCTDVPGISPHASKRKGK